MNQYGLVIIILLMIWAIINEYRVRKEKEEFFKAEQEYADKKIEAETHGLSDIELDALLSNELGSDSKKTQ